MTAIAPAGIESESTTKGLVPEEEVRQDFRIYLSNRTPPGSPSETATPAVGSLSAPGTGSTHSAGSAKIKTKKDFILGLHWRR